MATVPLRETRIYCASCGEQHLGYIERSENQIIGRYQCHAEEHSVVLSSDAELYQAITGRSFAPLAPAARPLPKKGLLNLVEITNTCNFTCPVCYAACAPKKEPHYESVDSVVRKITQAQEVGAKSVTLTGGEPTEHPELPQVVAAASRLGVRVNLATNGFRLGRDRQLASRLKAAGLRKVSIQLDTFDPEVHRLIRGNDFLAEKLQAVENCRAAGLILGLVATITHLNVGEMPRLLDFALQQAPSLSSIAFQLANQAGRHTIPPGPTVDREQAIKTLLQASPIEGLHADHFWPLPHFRPWGLVIHPDCGVNLYVLTQGQRRWLLDQEVPLDQVFRCLGDNRMPSNVVTKNAVPLWYLLRHTPPRSQAALLGHLFGFLTGKGRRGLVIVGIGGFVDRRFYDQARVDLCPTTIATEDGPASPCLHFR